MTDQPKQPKRLHKVSAEEAGMRLDRLARRFYAGKPLGWVYRQIRTGAIRVDGKKRPQAYRLSEGEELSLPAPMEKKQRRVPSAPWRGPEPLLVQESESYVVVSKPAGLSVQGGVGTGAENLVRWLERRYAGAEFVAAPAHRIDRETSGLVLCAKKASVARKLLGDFKSGAVDKFYLALAEGRVADETVVDAPLDKISKKGPTKMGVRESGRASKTRFMPIVGSAEFTLVLAELFTGRTHQIRAHLSHIRHPLAGDERYGGAPYEELGLTKGAFLLHAWRLSFPDPDRPGERVKVEAPLPERFEKALRRVDFDFKNKLSEISWGDR